MVTDAADPTKQFLVDGQRTKGVERALSGKLTRQWSVMGGYAYHDAQLIGVPGTTQATAAYPGCLVDERLVHRDVIELAFRVLFRLSDSGC